MLRNTNATSFERFCCFHKEMNSGIEGHIRSLAQMVNATKSCFSDLNITMEEQFQISIGFVTGSYRYDENECQNSCNTPVTASHIGYIVLWVFIFFVTTTSNLTVLAAVHKVSYLRDNVGNYFISSLALSDFLVGIFIIPTKIKFAYNNLHFCSESLCRFYITADTALFSTSISNLFIISIDRYLALTFPYKYKTWMTMSKCKCFIAGIWIYGCFWGSLSNMKWHDIKRDAIHVTNYQCEVNGNYIYVAAVFVLVFYIPAIIMALIYFRILSIAKYHAQGISESISFRSNNPESDETDFSVEVKTDTKGYIPKLKNCLSLPVKNKNANQSEEERYRKCSRAIQIGRYRRMIFKATKTITAVYGTFIVCWLPVSIVSLTIAFCHNCFHEAQMKWFYIVFVEVLPVVNSMLNPFIYAVMNKQYRRAYSTILSKFRIFTLYACAPTKEKLSFAISLTEVRSR